MLDPQGRMEECDFHGTRARWRSTPEKMEKLWNAPQTEVPGSHGRIKLGKYERQHFIGVNPKLREEQKQQQIAAKEEAFVELILKAYRAEPVTGYQCFHGKRTGRLVSVGPVNLPVTRLFVEEIILECRQKHITKVDILGFEFEMGLFPNVLDEARGKGIDIAPKYIPAHVFDKRAVERNQVVFHDVAAIEVKVVDIFGNDTMTIVEVSV